jgi:hypothetical protein
MIQIPYRVRYRLGFGRFIFGQIFCIGMSLVLGKTASTNQRGLTINHGLFFSTQQATDFYWFLSGVSAVAAVLLAVLFIKGIVSPKYFELTQTELRMGRVVMPYSAITSLREWRVRGRKIGLHVCAGNKTLLIHRRFLPGGSAYEEVKIFLASRIRRGPPATYSRTSARR